MATNGVTTNGTSNGVTSNGVSAKTSLDSVLLNGSGPKPTLITKENIRQILGQFDHVLTDCDGVIWILDKPLPGASEFINILKQEKKDVFYVTNNSTKSRHTYMTKCQKLGFPATVETFYCTAACVGKYLQRQNFKQKVYVVGTSGVGDELDFVGIEHFGIGADHFDEEFMDQWELDLDHGVGAVVVGFDGFISYPKILKAASYLKDPKVQFLGTNIDSFFPRPGSNTIQPGTGTMVQAVATASGRDPIVFGKPSTTMFDLVKEDHPKVNKERCLMIGDNCQTDMVFGKVNGLKTLCVMTGVTENKTLADLITRAGQGDKEALQRMPDYVVSGTEDLIKFWKQTS